ncbi:hypothetical protein P3X46_030806 [Hevea brasiliensis]|uniref:NAC domain-containing protein n=1 Tax=Hevea brasiliensis TaxID=3981 RepID=A0ABQ9KIA2_HEVBR|nr:NAC domain-containing protein 83 [Hevea brasiliensis]KAJ9140124.1 hypothetical protein P3X46_030806 [Hevea brasiliensis]
MMKLPPGFRFQPTDEELVFEYLKRKVLSWPLPASIIPEINVCKYDPWDLPGDIKQEGYFFSNKEVKYPNGNRINRATASGYWKATGLDRQIGSSHKNHAVGMKKTLVFYRGKTPHATRTDWIMHEYRLVSVGTVACKNNFPLTKNSAQNSSDQIEKWVLCRIFLKKRNSEIDQACKDDRVENVAVKSHMHRFFYFTRKDNIVFDFVSSSSSSSSSSVITEVSNGEDLDEESNSSSSSRNIF